MTVDDDPLALEAFRDAMDDILEAEGRVELWIEPPPEGEDAGISGPAARCGAPARA
jgi:hypothetical protein